MNPAGVPLDEIVTIAGGGTPSTNRPEYFRGKIPWISPKDMKCWDIVDSLDHVTEEAIANSSTTLIARGAVLVVIRSGVLKHTFPVAINRVPVTLNQDMKALICSDRVIPDYLARALQALSPKLLQTVRGTTADNISTDVLRALEIPLPTLPEQGRIAGQLERADRLRRIRRHALELTDDFLSGAFLELFGEYLTPACTTTFNDVLGLPLSNGFFEKNSVYGTGVPVIWVDNLYHTLTIDLDNLRRARATADQVTAYRVMEGDLLFTRSSLVREGIGQINIVPRLPEPTLFECHVIRARVDPKRVNPFYVLGLYRSSFGKAHILRRANTATMTTISQGALEELPCPLPPLPLQQKFAALVERVERLGAVQREGLRQAEHLFASLLVRAFSG
jgi:type I restriction enzyme S subunit